MRYVVVVLSAVVVALLFCVLALFHSVSALKADVVDRDAAQSTAHNSNYKMILGFASDFHDIREEITGIDARLDKDSGRSVELLDRVIAVELKLGLKR